MPDQVLTLDDWLVIHKLNPEVWWRICDASGISVIGERDLFIDVGGASCGLNYDRHGHLPMPHLLSAALAHGTEVVLKADFECALVQEVSGKWFAVSGDDGGAFGDGVTRHEDARSALLAAAVRAYGSGD